MRRMASETLRGDGDEDDGVRRRVWSADDGFEGC